MARRDDPPLSDEIERAEDKLRVLEAIAIACREPRAVLDVIVDADDSDSARVALRERFGLDEIQAIALMDLQYRFMTLADRRRLLEDVANTKDRLRHLHSLES